MYSFCFAGSTEKMLAQVNHDNYDLTFHSDLETVDGVVKEWQLHLVSSMLQLTLIRSLVRLSTLQASAY